MQLLMALGPSLCSSARGGVQWLITVLLLHIMYL